MTIACVLRSGGIYTPDWVAHLKRNVREWVPAHRFVCLSDIDVPCERVPLRHEWPGWWSKIELFSPGLFTGRVLYLDLDVLVTGELGPLVDGSGLIAMQDTRFPGINSSVMAWDAGDTEFYDRFTPDTMRRLRSDQDWLNEVRPAIATFAPGLVVSYKDECRGDLPENARIVVCHGRPKPPDIKEPWFRSRWASCDDRG